MIRYTTNLDHIDDSQLDGFFVGWPNPPSITKHKELLEKSSYVWLAIDQDTEQVIGFITAISDDVLSAYIPFLEVLPSYQKQGIGTELVKHMLESLQHLYMIDLLCDEEVTTFYKRFKMFECKAMCFRNYNRQSGQ